MEEKISVIVPVYNAQETLSRCAESILAQTYKELELLLIDDGSTDNSPAICDSFAEKDPRVRVFHKENGGPSAARNVGLKAFTGRYLTFVDSDDYIDPDTYERLIDEIRQSGVDMVVYKWYRHNAKDGSVVAVDIESGIEKTGAELAWIIAGSHSKCGGGYPWNRVIDWHKLREKMETPVLFREELNCYEDKIWLLEILKYMDRVAISDVRGYHYRIMSSSLSRHWTAARHLNAIKAWDIMAGLTDMKNNTEARDMYNAEVYGCLVGLCGARDKKNFVRELWNHKGIVTGLHLLRNPKRIPRLALFCAKAVWWSIHG